MDIDTVMTDWDSDDMDVDDSPDELEVAFIAHFAAQECGEAQVDWRESLEPPELPEIQGRYLTEALNNIMVQTLQAERTRLWKSKNFIKSITNWSEFILVVIGNAQTGAESEHRFAGPPPSDTMETPQQANAAQLAARKLAAKPKRRGANRSTPDNSGERFEPTGGDTVPQFANPDGSNQTSFGTPNSIFGAPAANGFGSTNNSFESNNNNGGSFGSVSNPFGNTNGGGLMFGGGLSTPAGGAFNFNAGNLPTLNFGNQVGASPFQSQPSQASQLFQNANHREDTTGEEAARKNKGFRSSPAPQITTPSSPFQMASGQSQQTADQSSQANAQEAGRRNTPFTFAAQQPLPQGSGNMFSNITKPPAQAFQQPFSQLPQQNFSAPSNSFSFTAPSPVAFGKPTEQQQQPLFQQPTSQAPQQSFSAPQSVFSFNAPQPSTFGQQPVKEPPQPQLQSSGSLFSRISQPQAQEQQPASQQSPGSLFSRITQPPAQTSQPAFSQTQQQSFPASQNTFSFNAPSPLSFGQSPLQEQKPAAQQSPASLFSRTSQSPAPEQQPAPQQSLGSLFSRVTQSPAPEQQPAPHSTGSLFSRVTQSPAPEQQQAPKQPFSFPPITQQPSIQPAATPAPAPSFLFNAPAPQQSTPEPSPTPVAFDFAKKSTFTPTSSATSNGSSFDNDLPAPRELPPVQSSAASASSSSNIFAQANIANQVPPPSPKPATKALINGDTVLPSVELVPRTDYSENLEDMANWDSDRVQALTPSHFTDLQKVEFEAAFRVRSLNVGLQAFLRSRGPCDDFSPALQFYTKTHKIIKAECENKKRKVNDGDRPLNESPAKRSKPNGVSRQQAGDSPRRSPQKPASTTEKQGIFSTSKSSGTAINSMSSDSSLDAGTSAFPVLAAPSSNGSTATAQATVECPTNTDQDGRSSKQISANDGLNLSSASQFAVQPTTSPVASPKGKRKAEVQLTKDNPTGDEQESGRRIHAKPGGSSNTMNRFKDILDNSAPAKETPTKSNPFASLIPPASTSKVQAATPTKSNPFASLAIPSTAPPAAAKSSGFAFAPTGSGSLQSSSSANIFAAKAGESTTPSATTSKALFAQSTLTPATATKPLFGGSTTPASKSFAPTTNIFTPKSGSTVAAPTAATNPFAAKSSNASTATSAIKPPTFSSGPAPVNFLAQFGQQAEKNKEAAELKAMQRAKDEDMDSDEDEAEWEAKYKAKRQAEKKALEEATKKPAGFVPVKASGSQSNNFLAQFGQQAEKNKQAAELKAMQRAKDEDMDSDEDEAEWEAKYKAKRQAEKKALEDAAKDRAGFVPGKGFSINAAAKDSPKKLSEASKVADTALSAHKPLFGKSSSEVTPGLNLFASSATSAPKMGSIFGQSGSSTSQNIFAPTSKPAPKSNLFQQSATSNSSSSLFAPPNRSETSSPAAASSTGSVFDSQEPKGAVSFGNIFGHVSDSGADNGPDDASTDEEDGDGGDEDQENTDPNEEKTDPTYIPSKDSDNGPGTPGTPVEETGAGIASAKKPSSLFSFTPASGAATPSRSGSVLFGASQPASGTNTPTASSSGGLFDRISKDSSGNPIRKVPAEDKENAGPASNSVFGTSSIFSTSTGGSNPFGSLNKTPGGTALSPGNNTWNQNTPIKFGVSATSAAPNVSVTTATPEKAADKPSPFAGLFGNNSTPKPSLFAGFGSGTTTPKASPFSAVNADKPSAPAPFSFLGTSNAGSTATSRATTPGATTDNDSASEANDPDAEVHEQIDLTSGAAGEEDEDVMYTVRTKAMKFVVSSGDDKKQQWVTKGLGPLKVLKHRTSGASRVLLRADPSGTIVLNKSILSKVNYEASKKTVKLLTADEGGKGLETWLLQVKTEEMAKDLAKSLEDNKS